MLPSARIAAAIEVLDTLIASWSGERPSPADRVLDKYFRERRFMGSKDRGAVSELVYWCLRNLAALDWWRGKYKALNGARSLVMAALLLRRDVDPPDLAALFDGGKYAPAPLTDSEWKFAHAMGNQSLTHPDMPDWVRLNIPEWITPLLKDSLGSYFEGEMQAMAEQAPVDLRANTLLITRDALMDVLKGEGFEPQAGALSPVGIRLGKREAIFASPAFRQGFFEMQDEGSQVVSLLVDAAPGMRVIDFCAGAGGKTLAVAAQMRGKGKILAFDTSAKRLAQLLPRLKRAQVSNTEWRVIDSETDAHLKRHKQSADRVLVDAPCTGTGTWRRNPDLKWRFKPKDLDELVALQGRILTSAARLVKIGGRLVYATCSLLRNENELQIETFLQSHPNFRVVCAKKIWDKICNTETPADGSQQPASFLWLTPQQDGVDGFFAAVLERTS